MQDPIDTPTVALRWRRLSATAVERGAISLDAHDRARRDRFTHEDARDHMVASRGLLADSLVEAGLVFDSMERAEKGKPRLVNGPEFNLSHSHGALAVALVSDGANVPVGVDVEAPWRRTDFDAVSRRFFATSETDALRALDDGERRRKFFELWTLKEAVLKATGKGLTQPLSSVVFGLNDRWSLQTELPGQWSLGQWVLESGHIFAAAVLASTVDWDGPTELPVTE